jgi:transcription antitermination factor NusG
VLGDFVRILNGSYRNQLVEVDEVWKERKQVRVNLNGIATKKNEDIFSDIEIINIKK